MRLTRKILRSVLSYDPDTGLWRWKKSESNRVCVGDVAGHWCVSSGYVTIGIRGRNYGAHRLAWFYMTGRWPPRQIDHRDMRRSNNRWENLRLATNQQNARNRSMYKNNKCGRKGVHWNARCGKWRAQIRVGGKRLHLGLFNRAGEAAAAYRAAAVVHFGEFARG